MKERRYQVRLQAKEDEVYHLMDLKEWFSVLIGLGSFLEGIALYFFIFRIRAWDLAYLLSLIHI